MLSFILFLPLHPMHECNYRPTGHRLCNWQSGYATGLHAVAEHWLHNGLVVQQAPCCATERTGHLFLAFARPEITAASRIEMNRIHYACMHVLCTQGVTV